MESNNKTNRQNKTKSRLIDTENRLAVARGLGNVGGGGKMDYRDQQVPTSSYNISKSWGWNIQHGNTVNNIVFV